MAILSVSAISKVVTPRSAALAKSGVGAQVLSAEGYGSKFATVPAEATNNERAIDRKMAIRFAK